MPIDGDGADVGKRVLSVNGKNAEKREEKMTTAALTSGKANKK